MRARPHWSRNATGQETPLAKKLHWPRNFVRVIDILVARVLAVVGLGKLAQCFEQVRDLQHGDPFDDTTFVAAAKEFIPLLRQHIDKENNILFQMAKNVLGEADDADLTEKFSNVEQERDLDGMHERYDAEVARWEDEGGPSR